MRSVLHIINGEYYSGAERVQDLLSINLAQYGYDVSFACLKLKSFKDNCQTDKNKINDFSMGSRIDIWKINKLSDYIKNNDIKIIHTHTPRTSLIGFPASLQTGIPIVHHVHSPTIRDSEKIINNYINTKIENYVIRRVSKVIVVSQSLRQYVSKIKKNMDNVVVVHNGVPTADIENFTKVDTIGNINIGTAALFRPRKGLEVLLSALHVIKQKGITYTFHAIGEFINDDYRRDIEELIRIKGLQENIVLHGFVSDVYTKLSKLDIFVLPSLYGEGLPMVILEAMANGIPVVSANVEGVIEAIPTERFGLLVEPGNIEELTAAITYLIENGQHRESIARAAYERQINHLSVKSMTQSVANIYQELLCNE
ncbi:MAG: glycosyltransferase family 4 protein [Candidatus Thiodiazotropha sp.]